MADLKLFAFQPQGHGQLSAFVMAETEAEAIAAIDKYIADRSEPTGDYYNPPISDYDFEGWKTDYYQLTVAGCGDVILNAND